jgi:hypothetical protein
MLPVCILSVFHFLCSERDGGREKPRMLSSTSFSVTSAGVFSRARRPHVGVSYNPVAMSPPPRSTSHRLLFFQIFLFVDATTDGRIRRPPIIASFPRPLCDGFPRNECFSLLPSLPPTPPSSRLHPPTHNNLVRMSLASFRSVGCNVPLDPEPTKKKKNSRRSTAIGMGGENVFQSATNKGREGRVVANALASEDAEGTGSYCT